MLNLAYTTFRNYRAEQGDGFLCGYDFIPGRVLFRIEDVRRLAAERAR